MTEPALRSAPALTTAGAVYRRSVLGGSIGHACLSATDALTGLTSKGLPVDVQIVGPQFGDRSCITLAGLLERTYRCFTPPPNFG
jgi:Asp-tRNA(Asn)/Glu-tRNA(Gln) amidotransferase A subunit family amidase